MSRRRTISTHLSLVISLLSLICFSACKAPYAVPTKEFIHQTDRPLTTVDEMTVIIDPCIAIDDFTDYYSVETSRSCGAHMAAAVKSYFENIGYPVIDLQTPFVGAYKTADAVYWVRQKKGDRSVEINPPFYVDEQFSKDEATRETFIRVLREVYIDMTKKGDTPSSFFNAHTSLHADLDQLRDHLKTRYVLFVMNDARSVSGLTSFSQAMLTGVATGVLTGGFLAISVYDMSHIDTYAALVDLEQKELLWSNSLRLKDGNLCQQNYYAKWNEHWHTFDGWAQQIFFHLPVKPSKFIEAAQQGNNNRLEWMLLTETDLNAADENGMTALHWAVKEEHLNTVKYLVKCGAEINCPNHEGDTPLHCAVRQKQYNIAKLLLEKKADAGLRNQQGQCALDLASANQDKKLTKLLTRYQKQ